MRIKSKHLKKWNLPGYGTKLDCVKSKPYPFLFAFLAASVILFSLNQKVIGIALLALTCYQLGVGNNSTICEFFDRYVVFYDAQDHDGCYILFWQDVAQWQYCCGIFRDTLSVTLRDGTSLTFNSLSRRKIEHYFRQYVPDVEMPIGKQHI